jgi:hypothetical protein
MSCLTRLALCIGLLTISSACDFGRPPTGPSGLQPVSAPNPLPAPPAAIPTTTIAVGEVIHASIDAGDSICDPAGWDARSPCKRFLVTPSMNGTLTVILTAALTVPRNDVIDVMLYRGTYTNGLLLRYSDGGGTNQQLSAPVVEGQTYEIRINSYPYLLPPPGRIDFELRTEM